MKRLTLVLAFMALATAAQAQRPLTTTMSCRQAQQLVAAHGGIVLGTGTYTYDRYVRDRAYCEIDEYIQPAWVPSRDTPQCPVGYVCRSGPIDPFGD